MIRLITVVPDCCLLSNRMQSKWQWGRKPMQSSPTSYFMQDRIDNAVKSYRISTQWVAIEVYNLMVDL